MEEMVGDDIASSAGLHRHPPLPPPPPPPPTPGLLLRCFNGHPQDPVTYS